MDSCIKELHFTHLHIPVTINKKFTVHPSSPRPANQSPHQTLYLSNLDDIIGAPVFTPSVYFYPSTGNQGKSRESSVMKRLQDALGEVLVPYYPLSGRLREVENGKLQVFFGEGQGALMVSANSSMALADLGDLTVPNPAWLPLIFQDPEEEPYKILGMPLLIAQETFFTCGGFSLGIRLCHCICDGFGALQFLASWAATTKTGNLIAEPEPVWDREVFKPRNPPMVKYPHHEYLPIEERSNLTNSLWETKPLQKCYRISKEFQSRVKSTAQGQDPTLVCSSFEEMAAHIWRIMGQCTRREATGLQSQAHVFGQCKNKTRNHKVEERVLWQCGVFGLRYEYCRQCYEQFSFKDNASGSRGKSKGYRGLLTVYVRLRRG